MIPVTNRRSFSLPILSGGLCLNAVASTGPPTLPMWHGLTRHVNHRPISGAQYLFDNRNACYSFLSSRIIRSARLGWGCKRDEQILLIYFCKIDQEDFLFGIALTH